MLGLLMLAAPLIVSEWLVNRGLIPGYLRHRHIVWRALASLLVVVGLVAWWHLPVMIRTCLKSNIFGMIVQKR
ncbi:hypothetical protein EFP25_13765 [Lactiplantibacillus pentosus]|nr:hypothetical protein [Lactiplantibacillus pentosus]